MTQPYKPKVLDLFSGIGGFSLGLERAGMETAAFCDNNPKCRALLKHHWPEVPSYDDVETITGAGLVADGVDFDILCGGFPCQDLSYAGKGAGLDGARSGLWFQIARILRERRDLGRPVRFVVLENVSALLARGLGVVLGDLASLGFDAWWDCIPASAVGAPHRRDRIWIVAYPRGEQYEGFCDALRREIASGLSEASMANATGQRWDGSGSWPEPSGRDEPSDSGQDVADAISIGQPGSRLLENASHQAPARGWKTTDAFDGGVRGIWSVEPDVGRVAHGVPARVDRLHGLGNAVVPLIPEIIGKAILKAEAEVTHRVFTPPP